MRLYSSNTILKELRKFLLTENQDIIMIGTPSGVGPAISGKRFQGKLLDGEEYPCQFLGKPNKFNSMFKFRPCRSITKSVFPNNQGARCILF